MSPFTSIDLSGYKPGPVGHFAVQLFNIAAHKPLRPSIARLPVNGMSIIAALYQGAVPEVVRVEPAIKRDYSVDKSRAMVAFSGGKDSTAVAVKLIKQGFKVFLFNVQGINPAYPEEAAAAARTAQLLGAELVTMRVKLGSQSYIENPAKNQVILGLMIDAGLRHVGEVGTYAMGIMTTEEAEDVAFEYGYSDAIEMHRAGAQTYESMAPGIKVETELLRNEIDSYNTILGHDPALLRTIQSCMTPVRYRGVHHRNNKKKFGGGLLHGRCGSCYKCAQEVLILSRMGFITPSAALVAHAGDVLVKAAPKLIGSHAGAMSRAQIINYFTKDY